MPLPAQLVIPSGTLGSLTNTLPPTDSRSIGVALTTESAPILSGLRGRRRALLRQEGPGLGDRPVLLEWFTASPDELARRLAEAQKRQEPCHINLLRVVDAGLLSPQSGYALSEAPAGVDLLSVLRAARPRGVPTWWLVAVAVAVGRGLQALHPHLPPGVSHGGLSPAAIFVGWQGEVQLLAFSALVEEGSGLRREAPEVSLRLGARLFGPASDVYALARLLVDLLPEPEGTAADSELRELLAQALAADPSARPALRDLCAGFSAYLQERAPPALAQAVGGVLQDLYPRESASDQQGSGELDLTPLPDPQPAPRDDPQPRAAPLAALERTTAPPPAVRIPLAYWIVAALLCAAALAVLLLGGDGVAFLP